MKFWDTSALVPLLFQESSSPRLRSILAEDLAVFVWWGSGLECISALARREREGRLDAHGMATALAQLRLLSAVWHEIDPSEILRETAARFLRVHPLRAADALQLAAAFVAAEQVPSSLDVVSLDERLSAAARKEGFVVVE